MKNIKDKKKDWLFLIAYVALIYGTLSVVPVLSVFLRRIFGVRFPPLINLAVAACIILTVIVFYKKLKGRKLPVYFSAALILVIYAFLLLYCTPISSEKIHLIEYGFLAYLVLRTARDMRSRDMKYLYVIMLVAVIGYGDELLQKILPNRVYDLRDIAMNALSGILALVLLRLFGQA